ncbi:MAG TPA: LPS-assembly protein LptD [Caulobacteraceae bacterium]|nr:LPS-assembly protein LptD [Caulobacteraceae bacterium]
MIPRGRTLLLGSAAALALAPAAALAQNPAPPLNDAPSPAQSAGLRGALDAPAPVTLSSESAPPPAPVSQPGDDGLGDRDVYLEADTLTDDRTAKVVTARGSVEARHNGRTLRADEVIYNTETGEAHAKGHVVLINPDGSVEYSDDVVLDDDLKAGFATAFAARVKGNITIAAGSAVRRNENVNELNKAIYTPCNICAADGSPKEPTWSVQASRVIQDREHQVVYYRNAVIRIKGVPVLYTPIFWHPDPSAERRSGFLAPNIRYANRLGISYEQPYLWVISPSADLVVSPVLTTQVAPFLNLEYRQRFYSGVLHARVGYTYEKRFDSQGKYGPTTSRSYILADGLFQLDDKWQWGFGAERVSDPTLFARYRIDDIYGRRGPFTTDTQRLLSQVFATRQDARSYFSISAITFQSLRVLQVGREIISYDPSSAFPLVAPLIEARFDPDSPVLGGRFRFQGSAVALTRSQTTSLVTPAGANQGIDDRRVSASADWRRPFTMANGLRVEPFGQARIDAYSIDNPLAADPKDTFSRGLATIGADVSWPFIRQRGNSSIILEPLAQVAISPDYKPNPNVPNEDSVALVFDSTNLFSSNRFPGFDLYEGGQRVNVGGRSTFNWGAGHSASVLVGRSFRDEPNPAFYVGSGLEGRSSDWVTAVTLAPIKGLNIFSRSRLDAQSLKIRREEAGIDVNLWRISASTRYLYTEKDASGLRTESINMNATVRLTNHWGVSGLAVRDLDAGQWPFSQLSVYYQDECIRVDVIYSHNQTFASTISPANSIQLRLTLATLGGQGR